MPTRRNRTVFDSAFELHVLHADLVQDTALARVAPEPGADRGRTPRPESRAPAVMSKAPSVSAVRRAACSNRPNNSGSTVTGLSAGSPIQVRDLAVSAIDAELILQLINPGEMPGPPASMARAAPNGTTNSQSVAIARWLKRR